MQSLDNEYRVRGFVSPSSTPPGTGMMNSRAVSSSSSVSSDSSNPSSAMLLNFYKGSVEDPASILYRNNICKSFEDDLFFCPRSLLSPQEQKKCQEIDSLFTYQQHASSPLLPATLHELSNVPMSPTSSPTAFNTNPMMNFNNMTNKRTASTVHRPMSPRSAKFNPYKSQSFNPSDIH